MRPILMPIWENTHLHAVVFSRADEYWLARYPLQRSDPAIMCTSHSMQKAAFCAEIPKGYVPGF